MKGNKGQDSDVDDMADNTDITYYAAMNIDQKVNTLQNRVRMLISKQTDMMDEIE